MAIKKLIATTVSSRETGQKRRNEGKTTSSQMHTATQENQRSDRGTSEGGGRDKLKKVDGDVPECMRHKKDNNDDSTRKTEDLKGKGGGRLKHSHVDGDVPLCLRKTRRKSKDSSSSSNKKNSKEKMKAEAAHETKLRMEAKA